MTTIALEARGLGKRYRSRWALEECNLTIPAGCVVGLVGPNGAGKTTLLHLATGLLKPSAGSIEVAGGRPASSRAQLAKVGFVAQDTPTYAAMSITDHFKLGAHLNPNWDEKFAVDRMKKLGLDPRTKASRLSGGQRAQVALTMAVAKRPDLLILDEPVAALDPLARREFLEALLEAVAERRMGVILSTHVISDLELTCDFLVVLNSGQVQVSGPVPQLLAAHRKLAGPYRELTGIGAGQVITSRHGDRKTTAVVRTDRPSEFSDWDVSQLNLEELVLAYMNRAADRGGRSPQEAVR
jgi:ABC-2 type transport system ATP-binding protein